MSTHAAYSKQQGTTLIEVLITMGLLSIFMVVLTTIITACFDIQSRNSGFASTTSDAQYILSRLDYDIRRASSIENTNQGLSLTIADDTYTYTTNNGRLTLNINGEDNYLTSPTTRVTDLSFEKIGSGAGESVRYSFMLLSSSAHDTQSQIYTSTTGLRP